ncbi:MAG: hypothetical protein ACM3PE_01715 [Deltaproteobacteria bacterium]
MEGYKRWFYITFLLIMLPLLGMGGFNYYIDPLWCFSHSNRYNSIQMPFDERQQKTNQVRFAPFDYDTLLLGSSRVTYMDQRDFTGHKTYNYAVSLMDLEDYYDFIEHAKARHGGEFDCIVLGMDFYATNRNMTNNNARPAAYYVRKSGEFAYRYKILLSRDVFKYSLKNYRNSARGVPLDYAYDRKNIKTLLWVSPEAKTAKIKANQDKYRNVVYADYAYEDVRAILGKIKQANPHTRFIVFTTPESWPLFEVMVDQGLYPFYEKWLTDIVEVFGAVYNFDYPNVVTVDLDNYYDASHIYPATGTLLAHRVVGNPDPQLSPDFGVLVTRDNLARHLEMVQERIREKKRLP